MTGEAPPPAVADRAAAEHAEFLRTVSRLRAEARARSRSRPRRAFDGRIDDEIGTRPPVRRYRPAPVTSSVTAIFLHGGYGLFGDVDLQDGWCRRLATVWACDVISVDYPLAPEHSLDESVEAVVQVIAEWATPHAILCGDSAGAGLALAAATSGRVPVSGLILTNPNIDLTLARFDRSASAGPDADLSARAFAAWTQGWAASCDFVTEAASLPPTFVAVGVRDAVLAEARDLVAALSAPGQRCELVECDAGHGFLDDEAVSDDVLVRAERFFGI